jgi:two-component system LytT family sensor kinase
MVSYMRVDETRTKSREWLWIALVWLALALFDAAQTMGVMRAEGMHHNWPLLFAIEALSWLPWAAGTTLIFWLARRVPLSGRPTIAWLVHVAACICIGLIFSAWATLLILDFHPFGPPDPSGFVAHWVSDFYEGLLGTVVFYAGLLMIRNILDSRERLASQKTQVAQLNEQLANAHLNALRRQIEPHFLFNALNAVSGLIREGRPDAAADMVASLSDFLRRTLANSSEQEVRLSDEMEFVQRYLAIQQVRFAGRLRVEIDIPGRLQSASVPSLILQPLVENAVKHGIAKRKEGGIVRISAATSGPNLLIIVSNDGPVLPAAWNGADRGIGVSNVLSRLRALYGDDATLVMRRRAEGGVELTMSLSLHFAPLATALSA